MVVGVDGVGARGGGGGGRARAWLGLPAKRREQLADAAHSSDPARCTVKHSRYKSLGSLLCPQPPLCLPPRLVGACPCWQLIHLCGAPLLAPVLQVVPLLDPTGLDLLRAMLRYDPASRIRCRQALAHPWFDDVRWAQGLVPAMGAEHGSTQGAARLAAEAQGERGGRGWGEGHSGSGSQPQAVSPPNCRQACPTPAAGRLRPQGSRGGAGGSRDGCCAAGERRAARAHGGGGRRLQPPARARGWAPPAGLHPLIFQAPLCLSCTGHRAAHWEHWLRCKAGPCMSACPGCAFPAVPLQARARRLRWRPPAPPTPASLLGTRTPLTRPAFLLSRHRSPRPCFLVTVARVLAFSSP
jgi:hypothetical protein